MRRTCTGRWAKRTLLVSVVAGTLASANPDARADAPEGANDFALQLSNPGDAHPIPGDAIQAAATFTNRAAHVLQNAACVDPNTPDSAGITIYTIDPLTIQTPITLDSNRGRRTHSHESPTKGPVNLRPPFKRPRSVTPTLASTCKPSKFTLI
jgi:hypothetical protein